MNESSDCRIPPSSNKCSSSFQNRSKKLPQFIEPDSGAYFTLNPTLDEAKPEVCDALVISDGRAPEYIRLNEKALEAVRHFAKANKPNGIFPIEIDKELKILNPLKI